MQMIDIHSIEDCLEILTGLQKHNLKFEIDSSDATVIKSIARQVFKGTALTDRQYNLMKEKLLTYKEQFETQEVMGFDRALERLRNPLREIDRSKYIKIVSHPDMVGPDQVYESYKQDWKWIKVRFPFSKNLIMEINNIPNKNNITYFHEKGSHEHYFIKTEPMIYQVISRFVDRNFDIDSEIIELYNQIKSIKENPLDHLPCIFDENLYNVNSDVKNEISNLSYLQIIDRHKRHGLINLTKTDKTDLLSNIVHRTDTFYLSNPNDETLNQVTDCLYQLDRFPLLVVLDESHAEEQLYECYTNFKNICLSTEQSVLFRQEGQTDFNKFIKSKKLNNWVDNNTKIVYISCNKLPKVLLKSDWSPIASLMFGGRANRNVDTYVRETSDLVICRDIIMSPLRKYSQYYGNL